MTHYVVRYTREFQADLIAANDGEAVKAARRQVEAVGGTLLSIVADSYVERPCPGCEARNEKPIVGMRQQGDLFSGYGDSA